VEVTFDGKLLPADETNRVALPAYDEDARHVLSVALEYSPAVRSKTDVVFGGVESVIARSELTAVALRAASPERLIEVADLEGALLRDSGPLTIVAVERGPAVVCVVRGPGVGPALKALGTGGRTRLALVPDGRQLPHFDRDASRQAMTLEKGDQVRFVWPMPRVRAGPPVAQLFDRSRDFAASDAGIAWLLTRVEHPEQHPAEIRLADAAAVAGLEAAASGSRRAVVLVLGDETADRSLHNPASVRKYLETIRVPFFVWSLRSPAVQPLAKDWGVIEDVSSAGRLEKAVERLKADLASQRVLWVQGRHLPQEITLSDKAKGLDFAR